jgi:hypothetical protein
MRARSAQSSGTREQAHRTLNSTCPVYTGHQGRPRRQNLNGRSNGYLVTWLSHRTCPVCTGLSGAPSNRQLHQRSCLVVGAINTPTTPPFMASKFSPSNHLTRASFHCKAHQKRSNPLPTSFKALVARERVICSVHLSSCAWIASFLSHSFL